MMKRIPITVVAVSPSVRVLLTIPGVAKEKTLRMRHLYEVRSLRSGDVYPP